MNYLRIFAIAMLTTLPMVCVAVASTTLYVDGGILYYCKDATRRDTLFELFCFDVNNGVVLKNRAVILNRPFWHPEEVAESYVERFPRAWAVSSGILTGVYPDFLGSATGDVLFQLLTLWNPKLFCEKNHIWSMTTGGMEIDEILCGAMASVPFPSLQGLNAKELAVPWYSVGEQSVAVRLPSGGKWTRWSPTMRAISNEWMVISWDSSKRACIGMREVTRFDGYNPVAGVHIYGKKVQSDDDVNLAIPDNLDWLIWERNRDTCRLRWLCDGCWSVCKDAQRKDAPKIIVVNNDEQSVFLSFSQEFNADDVSNSLKRTAAYLKEHKALRP